VGEVLKPDPPPAGNIKLEIVNSPIMGMNRKNVPVVFKSLEKKQKNFKDKCLCKIGFQQKQLLVLV